MIQDFVAEHFERQYAYLYQLTAVAAAGRFVYLVEDEENRVAVLRADQPDTREAHPTLAASLRQALPPDTLLRLHYRRIKLALATPRYSLVPAQWFDPANAAAYLQPVAPLLPNEDVRYQYLRPLDAYAVYPLPLDALEYLSSFFTQAACVHWASGLLLAAQQPSLLTGKPYLQVCFLGRMMHLALFDKGKLLYHNIFEYLSARDALYYVLLVYDQLKLHPERQGVFLCGEVVPDSDIYRELVKYIRQVDFVSRPTYYRFPEPGSGWEAPGHFYQDLFSLKLLD
jgi:hypothetical protein